MIVGIQGDKGSWNEQVCEKYCEQNNIKLFEIKYLLSTKNVLRELKNRKIDLGIFAISSQGLLVNETKRVIEKYDFTKVSELILDIHLLTLGNKNANKSNIDTIYGHSQTFKFIQEELFSLYSPNISLIKKDGENMFSKPLKNNEAVIGNKRYKEKYNLKIIDGLKTSYETKFYIVKY